jgi:flavorubredoxin
VSPTTVIPGKVYAVGDLIDVDGRVSWFAPEARGLAPVNGYVLLEDDEAMLVDSGVPSQEGAVVGQLRELVAPGTRLTIVHTRVAELDSFGNTASVVRALPVARILAQFDARVWAHFRPKHDRPGVDPVELWPDPTVEFGTIGVGTTLTLGGSGRVLDVVGAPLRLLNTIWLYDRATRTLLTSDAFGHAIMRGRDEPRVVDDSCDETTEDEVEAHLIGKFDWLANAETGPIRTELARIFSTHEVETIAPGFGRVLQGREVVARHVAMVDRALERVGVGAAMTTAAPKGTP